MSCFGRICGFYGAGGGGSFAMDRAAGGIKEPAWSFVGKSEVGATIQRRASASFRNPTMAGTSKSYVIGTRQPPFRRHAKKCLLWLSFGGTIDN